MGVYIQGMEMPTNCFDCPCYHHKIDDGYYDYEICRASGTVFNDGYSSVTGHKDHIDPFKARLDNCPLVLVPPHGRCVDADALIDKIIAKYLDHERKGELVFAAAEIKQDIIDLISDAPTIIEEER